MKPLIAIALLGPWLSASATELSFNRDVRPILSSKCFLCHGPDKAKGDLRLDIEEAAKKEALVPGKPEESDVILRITSHDEEEIMPPPESGKTLTSAEMETLRQWIAQGATYANHWAFGRVERPTVPASRNWGHNEVDAFVRERLDEEKLAPSPETERHTLLRRLSFDLTGLPPSVAEVAEFVNDGSPQAYEKAVERLLDSQAFGEHWGRQWLDAARYADSNGYEKDTPREAWFYRDWVMRALRDDMPYDQFLIEQLAGDLLPNPTQDQIVATGFLRNSMINEEGGVDPEQFRMAAMFDRMDALGKAMLGLTLQCAQCHTHKFDPIQHTDYYGIFAFLNNSAEGSATVYTPDQQDRRRKVLYGVRAIENLIKVQHPDWPQRMAAWEREVQAGPHPDWEPLQLDPNDTAASGQKFLPQPDGSYLAQSYSPSKTNPKFIVQNQIQGVTAIRLEAMVDPNLPHGGPGRSMKGLFALSEFTVSTHAPNEKPVAIKIASAAADLSLSPRPMAPVFLDPKKPDSVPRLEGSIEFAIDGKPETAWAIDLGPGRRNASHEAVFRLDQPLTLPPGAELEIALSQQHGGYNNNDNHAQNLGRFRISVTQDTTTPTRILPPAIQTVLAVPETQRTPSQKDQLFAHWRGTVAEFASANDRIEALWHSHPEGYSQLVLQELAQGRNTHRLDRGDFLSPKEIVQPAVPAFLNPWPKDQPRNRLGLARWMVSRDAPTTARSLVNRIWQSYFGTGLTATSDDLGSQGEPPTHPELLDWLAADFMDHGWSLKHLHRLIVHSATYRQSSRTTPELSARDPENRLLARGPRFRLGAEAIRDNALAVSGLLDPTFGGPSVFPPAPKLLFLPPASYGEKTWNEDHGPARYRRAVYTFQFRTAQYPGQQAFDAPSGEVACVRRPRSNTPLQALTVLNEPLFMECAQALGRRVLAEDSRSDEARLRFAFQRVLSRPPTSEETALMETLLEQQKKRGTTENASWAAVARVLLNLDETLTKE